MKKKWIALALVAALAASFTVLPASATNVDVSASVIDGGLSHSIALSRDGEVYVWGDNSNGQLGLGAAVTRQETPEKIPGLSSITAVAAGYNFSMALRFNGTVAIWGNGIYQAPTDVAGLQNVVAISAGQLNCLALTTGGRVFQWTPGQFPQQVYALQNVAAISAGATHCMALTRNGEVWTWGYNDKGQLGDGTVNEQNLPKKVAGLYDIVGIAAGVNHSLAVDFNGNVYAWGDNTYSQLGKQKVDGTENLRPMQISALKGIVQVAAGNGSSMARTADGRVYSWGYGEYGQLGNGSSDISKAEPTQMSRITGVTDIACGVFHNLAVGKNGSVNTWGRNNYGQLGTKKNDNSNTPVSVMNNVAVGTEYINCVLDGISPWAEAEIRELYPSNVTPPSLLNNYQGGITRGELAHLLVTVYEKVKTRVSVRDEDKFNDIANHPMKESILKAYSLGIINGTSEVTFSPWNSVTRQEAVTMICRFVGKMKGTNIPTTAKNISYYDDAAQVAEWAAPYVDYAYNHNIMKGSAGRFSPTGAFTVEQSLLTVARLMKENNWQAR